MIETQFTQHGSSDVSQLQKVKKSCFCIYIETLEVSKIALSFSLMLKSITQKCNLLKCKIILINLKNLVPAKGN